MLKDESINSLTVELNEALGKCSAYENEVIRSFLIV
jgi:hypothetical protein